MRRRSLLSLVAAVVGGLLASMGVVGNNVMPAAAAVPVAANLPVAKSVRLTVTAPNPVVDSRNTIFSADFAKADTYKNRSVSLQHRNAEGGWKPLKTAKMDKNGKVQIKLVKEPTLTYRLVALAGKGKKAVTTPAATAKSVWTRELNEDFTSNFKTQPDSKWTTRMDGVYVPKRQCSAADPANAVVNTSSGTLSLKFAKLSSTSAVAKERQALVAKQKRDAAIAKAKAAIKKADAMKKGVKKTKAQKAAKASLKTAEKMSTTKGCPQGVFSNAMISTEGRYTIRSGIAAAKVKFPKARGVHSAVWLQSDSGQEIDFIESFGFGKGITNYVHVPEKGALKKIGGYVAGSTVKKSSWWSQWHVFSVQWDANQLTFRVDGKVTKTIKKKMANRDYYIVLSLLSSDWELPLLKKTTSATMQVDWVRAWKWSAAA